MIEECEVRDSSQEKWNLMFAKPQRFVDKDLGIKCKAPSKLGRAL